MSGALRISLLLIAVGGSSAVAADSLLSQGEALPLRSGDTLALVGGTLVERMQHHGHLESLLQCAAPQRRLRVRNLGWSGDDVHGTARAGFEPPAAGYDRLLRDLQTADPSVCLVAYGFAEASSGMLAAKVPSAVGGATPVDGAPAERFESGLHRLVDDLQGRGIRVLLLRPFPLPGVKSAGYAQAMQRCQQAVDSVAAQQRVPVLEASLDARDAELFTADGLNPSAEGYFRIAEQLVPPLIGSLPERCTSGRLAELRLAIAEKNQLFFHRYRPQNETYLFLFRKHEQGNNAAEIPRFDPLIQQADAAIWRLAGQL